MNLTPEQQKIGKQSFSDAVSLTRRDVLKGAQNITRSKTEEKGIETWWLE